MKLRPTLTLKSKPTQTVVFSQTFWWLNAENLKSIFVSHWQHDRFNQLQHYQCTCGTLKVKGKGFPYSIPSVGPGADPSVQAVSLQVTVGHPPGGRLPLLSARPAVTSPAAQHHRPFQTCHLYAKMQHVIGDMWQFNHRAQLF